MYLLKLIFCQKSNDFFIIPSLVIFCLFQWSSTIFICQIFVCSIFQKNSNYFRKSIISRELVLNTYWVFNTLKKYWYWIFNTFWEEVLEKVLILSDWRSNTQYFFQEFFSHFNQKIQNFHAKLIFHSNKILEMKTLLQNQYFDSIYF